MFSREFNATDNYLIITHGGTLMGFEITIKIILNHSFFYRYIKRPEKFSVRWNAVVSRDG